MATSKKKSLPSIVDSYEDLQILCEEFAKRGHKITPTGAWDAIAERFIRKNNSRHYWKLLRFNWYLTQRMKDIGASVKNNESRIKKLFTKKKYETLEEHKKRFYKEIGKENKRIRSVERLVSSDKFSEHYVQYIPNKQFSNLEEVVQLNKMICDSRYDKDFNIKNHDNIGSGHAGQVIIHLLR
jgi:hypothetical protein